MENEDVDMIFEYLGGSTNY